MTHSWTVVCIELDEDSPYDDCRQISAIGYKAPTLKMRPVDTVSSMISSDLSAFHIEQDGEQNPLQPAKDSRMYTRTLDHDSPDDPLLSLPTKDEYETEQKYKNL